MMKLNCVVVELTVGQVIYARGLNEASVRGEVEIIRPGLTVNW